MTSKSVKWFKLEAEDGWLNDHIIEENCVEIGDMFHSDSAKM